MKRKNLKNTLAMVSVLALSAQLVLPSAIFAEGDSDTSALPQKPQIDARAENDAKDDIIFINNSAGEDGADKTQTSSIDFGVRGGRGMNIGMPDGEPPERPDGNGSFAQKLDGEPPERPDENGENTMPEPPSRSENSDKLENSMLNISSGDTLSIVKSDGAVLYTGTAGKDAKGVVFSSDELSADETYTLLINGETAATSQVNVRGSGRAKSQKPMDENFKNSEEI